MVIGGIMKTWEIEICAGSADEQPQYLYIETEDDIEIEIAPSGNSDVTHICQIDNIDELTDLIIRRHENAD